MAKKPSDGDYKRYVEWYRKQAEIVARKGHKMYSDMYSEKRFHEKYKYYRSVYQYDIKQGKRKTIGNLYQYMTRDQSYLMDYSTQKALRTAFPKLKPSRFETIKEIKSRMTDEDFDYIRYQYHLARTELSVDGALEYIAQTFFGSD